VGAGLVASVAPAAAAIDGLVITPRRLVTSDHSFTTGGPGTGVTLRLLQVSDLHLRTIGSLERQVLETLHDSHPDVVLFTGDMVDRRTDLWKLEIFLRECPRLPRMFAIVGNWEHWAGIPLEALARIYEQHGIELLVNRSIEFDKDGNRVRITGLDDLVGGHPDAAAALAGANPAPNHLVLAHCPKARDMLALPEQHPADLMLSGHTHGGQIAPFGVAMVLPGGSGGYVAGWYREGGPPLYVSRGLGTSLIPMRIGAAPELVRMEWSLA